jgi:V/A-type H+-transporting ATPase subunit I
MIIPMQKYTFLIYHREYNQFLKELQDLGALHIIERENELKDETSDKHQLVNRLDSAIQFLEKREIEETSAGSQTDGFKVVDEIIENQKELSEHEADLAILNKDLIQAEPWGEFALESIQKLEAESIYLKFFVASTKQYLALADAEIPIELISELRNKVYFVLIQKGKKEIEIDADELKLPEFSSIQLQEKIKLVDDSIDSIQNNLDAHAGASLSLLKACKNKILNVLNFEDVIFNTNLEANEKLMVLEGWVPSSKKVQIDEFLQENQILYTSEKASPKDRVPILLKNNRFSKLFEPVGAMFSLPSYSELDLTVFFAPFFMMFFGFCLGDAGYGLLFIVGAGLYKFKVKKEVKPLLSLIQLLGLATIVFGAISGTFFGINLIETEISLFADYKSLFLNPDKMFNLALVLGGLQIIYGLFIKAANQIRQYGLTYALSTFGWLIAILGSAVYVGLTSTDVISENKTILYSILSSGAFFILFFSDPEVNIFSRLGKGVWDIYSTVTGIFGDLLSYIRLFALGLSSAILGFVINDIAMQILGASKIMGPIFFVIFLLIGHTLNIMISSLGSFVHPMRLTFVEFYKNAGFTGGGEGYKPFQNNLKQ